MSHCVDNISNMSVDRLESDSLVVLYIGEQKWIFGVNLAIIETFIDLCREEMCLWNAKSAELTFDHK